MNGNLFEVTQDGVDYVVEVSETRKIALDGVPEATRLTVLGGAIMMARLSRGEQPPVGARTRHNGRTEVAYDVGTAPGEYVVWVGV